MFFMLKRLLPANIPVCPPGQINSGQINVEFRLVPLVIKAKLDPEELKVTHQIGGVDIVVPGNDLDVIPEGGRIP